MNLPTLHDILELKKNSDLRYHYEQDSQLLIALGYNQMVYQITSQKIKNGEKHYNHILVDPDLVEENNLLNVIHEAFNLSQQEKCFKLSSFDNNLQFEIDTNCRFHSSLQ